jgi:adenylate cyclase
VNQKVGLNYSFGIAAKMILVVTLIIVGAISTVVFIATDLFKDESITRAQENNKDSANNLSDRVYTAFQNSSQQMKLMAQFATNSSSIDEARRAIDNAISGSEDLVSFHAYLIDEKGIPKLIIQSFAETAISEFSIDKEKFKSLPEKYLFYSQYQKPDEFLVFNSAPYTGKPFYTMSFMSKRQSEVEKPNPKEHAFTERWIFRAELRHSSILRIFPSKSFVSSYLVSPEGKLLAHSNSDFHNLMMQDTSMADLPIVDKMLSSSSSNHQMEYFDDYGEEYLGAYKKIGVAGLGVVSEISKERALATISRVQYRSLWVMIIIVCLAFFVNYGFSSSITQPIKKLFWATEQIVEGNFDVSLQASSTDEIGALSVAFKDMASGLKERDKIKTAFGKFHSKEIAQKLLSGEITLGGERKQATVFFSDIRGFTAMSEQMSPDDVVAMLNEYMTEMVRIIYKWNGVVDKYIGDAIMAVWGVPEVNPKDSYNAVRACLEMRDFMIEFNEQKKKDKKPQLGVGIGLHSGEVLAGNIGSEERLEYTIIGDTVNQASRIEGANKAVGSDILISSETYALIKDQGIVAGPAVAISAKGKSNDVYVHQVIGYKDESGTLVTTLSAEQIDAIENQTAVEVAEEEKVQLASKKTSEIEDQHMPAGTTNPNIDMGAMNTPQMDHTNIGAYPQMQGHMSPAPLASQPQIQAEMPEWYVNINGSNQTSGPFTASELALKVAHGQINPIHSYAFRQGDQASIPVDQVPGVNRRREMPPINQPLPPPAIQQQTMGGKMWFVHGPNGQSLGPFTEQQIASMMSGGNISRTTYVWTEGYPNWIYAYQIPGFDRRTA